MARSLWWLHGAALLATGTLAPRLVTPHLDVRAIDVELAHGVAKSLGAGVAATRFRTGSKRFDGEWAFGTYAMSTLGLGQTVLARPELRATFLPAMERAADELLSDETNAFGSEAWSEVGLRHLERGAGHAYLGYANLALSMLRVVAPDSPHAAISDALSEALATRLAAAPYGLFETYPGEAYPVDMAMVAGSIALHDCAVGRAPREFWADWRRKFADSYLDSASGFVYQAADASSGRALDAPRGSGTALAAYATSFVDRELSARLYRGLRSQALSVFGFAMMREYPKGRSGRGDIDSGPVLFGLGVSATGFALAGARLQQDARLFRELYRTVELWGVPLDDAKGRHFMSGGPLGNAILLAMSSATWNWSAHCRKAAQ